MLLKFVPDIEEISPASIVCAPGKDQFIERLSSEEDRINHPSKMEAVYKLRDVVFQDKIQNGHWNFETAVEVSAKNATSGELSCSDTGNAAKKMWIGPI